VLGFPQIGLAAVSPENITEFMGEWVFQLLDGMMILEQHLNEGDSRPWNLLIWEKFKCTVSLPYKETDSWKREHRHCLNFLDRKFIN